MFSRENVDQSSVLSVHQGQSTEFVLAHRRSQVSLELRSHSQLVTNKTQQAMYVRKYVLVCKDQGGGRRVWQRMGKGTPFRFSTSEAQCQEEDKVSLHMLQVYTEGTILIPMMAFCWISEKREFKSSARKGIDIASL